MEDSQEIPVIPSTVSVPSIPTNSTVFTGPISLPDQQALLEFMRKNLSIGASGRAHGSGNPTIPGSYTATKIAVSLSFVSGLTFDATNHRFVCITAGNYLVAAGASYVNTAVAEEIDVMIYKNGSLYSQGFNYTPGNLQAGAVLTDIVQLSIGDYIELYTIHGGVDRNLAGSSSFITIANV